jgi:hypothetical protein
MFVPSANVCFKPYHGQIQFEQKFCRLRSQITGYEWLIVLKQKGKFLHRLNMLYDLGGVVRSVVV